MYIFNSKSFSVTIFLLSRV